MAGYKNNETVTFKVDVKVKKKLDDIAEVWGIDRSAVVRSFVLACLYNLGRDIPYWVNREQAKVVKRVMPVRTAKADDVKIIDGGAFEGEVENKNYDNGLPKKDNKGNIIQESTWNFVKTHRVNACPCGSGKKYKKCHGI